MGTLLASPVGGEIILHQSEKGFDDSASSADEMIVLFCMLVGHKDIEIEMIKKYKELSLKPPQNVHLGPPKKNMVCSY